MAVSTYATTGEINNLWWRMQYGKIWFKWGKEEKGFSSCEKVLVKISIQKHRLTGMVDLFAKKLHSALPPIEIGSNGALIDGAHRLACYVFFGFKDVPVSVKDEPAYIPEVEDVFIREWYTEGEWEWIEKYKNQLINVARGAQWDQ
jgi:hypothetical protein